MVNLATVINRFRALLEDKKKVRYLIIGVWNTIFSYVAFVLLYSVLHQKIHYILILVVSQVVGLTNAYICYKFFVFKTVGNVLREYLKFYVVYGSTLLVNLVLIYILVEFLGLNPVLSQAVIAMIVVVMAYIGHSNFSFNSGK